MSIISSQNHIDVLIFHSFCALHNQILRNSVSTEPVFWSRELSFKSLTPNTWAMWPSLTWSKWNMDEICGLKFYLSYVDMPQEANSWFWKDLEYNIFAARNVLSKISCPRFCHFYHTCITGVHTSQLRKWNHDMRIPA